MFRARRRWPVLLVLLSRVGWADACTGEIRYYEDVCEPPFCMPDCDAVTPPSDAVRWKEYTIAFRLDAFDERRGGLREFHVEESRIVHDALSAWSEATLDGDRIGIVAELAGTYAGEEPQADCVCYGSPRIDPTNDIRIAEEFYPACWDTFYTHLIAGQTWHFTSDCVSSPENRALAEADMVLNNIDWCFTYGPGDTHCDTHDPELVMSFEYLLLHELGHALGLCGSHLADVVMCEWNGACDCELTALTDIDQCAIVKLYPPENPVSYISCRGWRRGGDGLFVLRIARERCERAEVCRLIELRHPGEAAAEWRFPVGVSEVAVSVARPGTYVVQSALEGCRPRDSSVAFHVGHEVSATHRSDRRPDSDIGVSGE